ncbi:hypothetical protein OK016_00245 [Vibrio chagasii]|nr:hypothetical protein [Vibrio chagasii]
MARTSGTTTVPASDDVYVGGDTASATIITDATGGNPESLRKTQQQQRRPSMMTQT